MSNDSRARTLGSDTAQISLTGEQMDFLYDTLGDGSDSRTVLDRLGEVVSESYGVPGLSFDELEWLDLDH